MTSWLGLDVEPIFRMLGDFLLDFSPSARGRCSQDLALHSVSYLHNIWYQSPWLDSGWIRNDGQTG